VPLKAYEDVVNEPLAFPIGGKIYTPPPLSAQAGIYIVKALAGDPDVANEPSRNLWQTLLGPAYDEMIADDVPMDALSRAGFAMLGDFQNNREAAVRVWESGIDPEARAALAAAVLSTTRRSTPPAAANTTPKRASGTGTPRKRTTAKKTTASRSRGGKSSRPGRS